MTHITVRGAHANNLQHVSLEIRPDCITLLRGPSGSGKSSFALDVVHAESRRRLLETLRPPGGASEVLPRVPVDHISGLPPTIAVVPDSGRPPDRPIIDLSDLGGILRDWFARSGLIRCSDSGQLLRTWTRTAVAEDLRQLNSGTRLTLFAPLPIPRDPTRLLTELRKNGFARVRLGRRIVRLDDIERIPRGVKVALVVDRIRWKDSQHQRLHEGLDTTWKAGGGRAEIEVQGEDTVRHYSAISTSPSGRVWPTLRPAHFHQTHPIGRCGQCNGKGCEVCGDSGLAEPGRLVEVEGATWTDLCGWTAAELASRLDSAREVQAAVMPWVEALRSLGLDHLPMGRSCASLGSGEWARLLLARVLPLAQPPRLLVIDEPLSTCSAEQARLVCRVLRERADAGVGSVVLSHRQELLEVADKVVTFGPGSGPEGGRVDCDAPPPAPDKPPTLPPCPPSWTASHPWTAQTLAVAQGKWTVVTGPSGSGTTALAVHALAAHFAGRPTPAGVSVTGPEPRLIERAEVGVSANARACVATSADLWGTVRDLLARTREARVGGLKADAFTFNRATGWCPDCEGRGEHEVSLGALAPLWRKCGSCEGGRLRPEVADIRWRGFSASDLLKADLATVGGAFSTHPRLTRRLRALIAVGLGHLPLGRRTASLSTGERRRFGVALAVARLGVAPRDPRPTLLVLDRPDAGLDDAHARKLASWLAESTHSQATLVTVAHHRAVLDAADSVVMLGS